MFFSQDNPKEEKQEVVEVLEDFSKKKQIVLFNDNVNTFDHVIRTLMQVCQHTVEQAEQSAFIVHYKGKCFVKSGSYEFLKPRCLKLLDAGLSAEII